MPKVRWLILFLLAAFLFEIANRGAYRNYFSDDDLDNISLSRGVSGKTILTGVLSPSYYENNFRPVGVLFYKAMAARAGLNFPPYAAFLHIVHLINAFLLWLILRRLSFPPWAAAAGTLFFVFHMAAFDIYWRPMYVFDLLCGTFCLLTLLFWIGDQWILSLLSFWLAYRSKELAVMLPAVLAAYEFLIGQRRWVRLVPFFAISLWFGIHGLQRTNNIDPSYAFHYGPAAIAKASEFYVSRLVLMPAGRPALLIMILVLLFAGLFLGEARKVWFGAAMFVALLFPMLLMSERLISAYLYVPLIGASIAVAAISARQPAALIALAFACWIPWNYVNLRWQRNDALSDVADRRRYLDGLGDFARNSPDINSYLYYDGPVGTWGVRGTIRWWHPGAASIVVVPEGSVEGRELRKQPTLAVLHWNRLTHTLETVARRPDTADAPYLWIGPHMPIWQLDEGWLPDEGFFRWTNPQATAHLFRPAGATEFELVVNVGEELVKRLHATHVEVSLNGRRIGGADFQQAGLRTVRWKLDAAPPGRVEFSISTSPPFPGVVPLGIAVCSFGFVK
jgi:hypothetical protein